VIGRGALVSDHSTGAADFSNHKPTPLLPAGNATRMRGSFPERSSRCAATGPSRRKLLMLCPSSMRKASAFADGGSAAGAVATHIEKDSNPASSTLLFMGPASLL
jgi:hypothetical protein